jgi:hypothetical protein
MEDRMNITQIKSDMDNKVVIGSETIRKLVNAAVDMERALTTIGDGAAFPDTLAIAVMAKVEAA